MLNLIMSIIMIVFGAKLIITPKNQLVKQFPKMPSATVAKIVGGTASILGLCICVVQILLWLGKI